MIDIEKYAEIVYGWLLEADEPDKHLFINAKDHELVQYHHTLGRRIRNEFDLWSNSWEPELINGIDYSVDHPDSVSMRIIRAVWNKTQLLR